MCIKYLQMYIQKSNTWVVSGWNGTGWLWDCLEGRLLNVLMLNHMRKYLIKNHRGILGPWKYSVWHYNDGYMSFYTCSNLGEGNGNLLQDSCLENPMEGGAWWAAVHGVAKSRTWLSNFTFTFHFHALEKEMATHSSVLAWRIPGTAEPGGLPPMGSHRVGHDWSDLAAAARIHCIVPRILLNIL